MELRIALLVLVGLLLGTPSGRARPPEVVAAMDFWRRAVWETDSIPFPETIPGLQRLADDSRFREDREVLFALAWSYRFVDIDAAAGVAERLRQAHPRAPELSLFESFTHQDAGRLDEADGALKRLLERVRSPRDHVPSGNEIEFIVTLLRASRHMEAQRTEDVVTDLEEARRVARERGARLPRWAITALADAHRRLSQFGRAAEVLEQAVADEPDYAGHAYELARLYATQQRDEEALAWYRRTQQLAPEFAPPYLKLAVMTFRAGDLDEMRRWLEDLDRLTASRWAVAPESREPELAAEIAAGHGLYWLTLGRRTAADGDEPGARAAYEAAREHLLASVTENPSCRRSLARLVEVGALLGRPQEEIESWKRALDELDERAQEGAGAGRGSSFC